MSVQECISAGSAYEGNKIVPDLKFFTHPLVGDANGRKVYSKSQGDAFSYNDTELLKLAPGFSPFVAYKKDKFCSAQLLYF